MTTLPAAGFADTVLAAVTRAGGRPYLVGGCVRDRLLGVPAGDVDVEVFGLALAEVAAALRGVGRVDEVGRAFAVLKVRRDGVDVDVAVPTAGPGTAPEDAARRRDFTVNALMLDAATGEVLDVVGGRADLRDGVLRHTGPAFADDPLRVLRGVRFAARYGFRFAPGTAALCRTLTPAGLPAERVWGEWRRIGEEGRHLSAALAALAATGWLAHVPKLAALAGVPQDPHWHPEGDVLTHAGLAGDAAAALADEAGLTGEDRAVVVLAALLHDVGKAGHTQVRADGRITSHGHAEAGAEIAREALTALGAPEAFVARVVPLVREHMVATGPTGAPRRTVVRRLARRLAPATVAEWSLVCGADRAGRGSGAGPNPTLAWLALAEAAGVDREPSRPLLRGADLVALGRAPGPGFGAVLAAALEAQDEGAFADTAGARAWLARLDADGGLDRLLGG
ncbi:CCA tRNA nucleotidyltransferase [Klenkia brasiliensis]|uniref:tRNA nucleotidyltransferase (CCA-adding enzyme) n=1 Tax=Klenkia brasiliensis TaxID=333142 RepID=A0A1G7YSM5_9ACTN|nr:HD domain-containing protein [Klenkia brasiliensis]SDG99592.1 tRNA nucleotidyltransferase (CCA-adding enzyme) [Klenkia brasiliensis]